MRLDELTIAVVGLGAMGRGIAQVLASAGANVRVFDVDEDVSRRAYQTIRREASEDGGAVEIVRSDTLADVLEGSDLVIETIVEDLGAKRQLLERVNAIGSEGLVVASNTSSLSIAEMGRALGDPGRFVGMHFFNPPPKMPLVEIVRGPGTRPETVDLAVEVVEALGKTAVVCEDSPNFIVNRVCRPLYYEAQLLVTQGVEPAVVDAVARGALGHPMGPLQLLDFVGIHTHLASSETAFREFGDPRYRPIPLARNLVRAGWTGKAVGRGFYDYGHEGPREGRSRVTRTPSPGRDGRRLTIEGPDKADLSERDWVASRQSAEPKVVLYRRTSGLDAADVERVTTLAEAGVEVLVDGSDGRWLDALPAGAGWVRLHPARKFSEVVSDPAAGIEPPPVVDRVLDAAGFTSVRVLALPGLIADRLQYCMINEATGIVEEGTAEEEAVDVALRLGMNHPFGPFEHLHAVGAPTVQDGLTSLLTFTGDPRYRPSLLLRRWVGGKARA